MMCPKPSRGKEGFLYRGTSVVAIAPVFNEEGKIGEVVRRVPRTFVDETLVIDDGSTDSSAEIARSLGATVLALGRTIGVGAALRSGFRYAMEKGYDVVVVMAGNNKDAPEEIPRLLDPIVEGRADFVQGSRFLERAGTFGAMPRYRRMATRLHPLMFSIAAGKRVTESTNGFRAIHTKVLRDPSVASSTQRL
jgi:dolichol-phosphate mannosyltransferase